MRQPLRSILTLALALSLSFFTAQSVNAQQTSRTVYVLAITNSGGGLDITMLLRFNSATPGMVTNLGRFTGLLGCPVFPAFEDIVALDFRPATNQLYGISTCNRIYIINPETAVATPVSATPFRSLTSVDRTGFTSGMDFNPVTDQIRLVSGTGGGTVRRNARLDPNTGQLISDDTPLDYVKGDPSFGTNPSITAVAYTNNFNGATTTTLYGIDGARDTLVRIGSEGGSPISPDSGQLFTIARLSVPTAFFTGLDIIDGSNLAVAVLQARSIHIIDLGTGAATLATRVEVGSLSVLGVTVAPPPQMRLTSPAEGSVFTVPATATITAEATAIPGTQIERVEFYAGDALIGTATSAPYEITGSTDVPGTYVLRARAIDNLGASAVSELVTVTVR